MVKYEGGRDVMLVFVSITVSLTFCHVTFCTMKHCNSKSVRSGTAKIGGDKESYVVPEIVHENRDAVSVDNVRRNAIVAAAAALLTPFAARAADNDNRMQNIDDELKNKSTALAGQRYAELQHVRSSP